ncbi:MAG: hypothetical protein JO053_08705 [Acidobacteria bacterium]|nr:hypothetical protein [Acidobacteriota bacterium]
MRRADIMMPDTPEPPSLRDDHAHFVLAGEYTLEDAIERVNEGILWCRANSIRHLLVDIREVTGFPSPSTSDRFGYATRWAATAQGRVVMAMVAPEHLIDAEKIGVMVANNRGFVAEAFTTEQEALRWLRTKGSMPVRS